VAGNTWARHGDADVDDLRYGANVFVAADTVIGPTFLSVGWAEGGRTAEWIRANDEFRRRILRQLEESGPLSSRDIPDSAAVPWASTGWTNDRNVTQMLQFLSSRGEIAVAGRRGRQRLWDLAERVYPPSDTLPWRDAEPLLQERRRRSLGVWLERGELRVHPEANDEPVPKRTTLLSPFDRLIHDRDRADALWGFFYRLEMYVPKAKRQYGYYVLPVLHGDKIVGRIDPVFDRKARVLTVNAVYPEDGVRFPQAALERALRSLGRWLGAEKISGPRR
jgi:uncharacterized protein YcaQ